MLMLPALNPSRPRVALVQGDPAQAEQLGHWLTSAGFLCRRYTGGQSLLRALRQESFDVLVLDWTLSDISGLDLLKQVRGALQLSVPVLFISARTNEADIVVALNQGADDYMVKPVGRPELLARLEAIRRPRGKPKPTHAEEINVHGLRIDFQTRMAWRDGRSIHLTAKDFDLSVLFLRNVGRLLYRGELWGVWCPAAPVSSRTLDTHISRIRKKLGLIPSYGWRLAAVYGHGYRLEEIATLPRHIDSPVAVTPGIGVAALAA